MSYDTGNPLGSTDPRDFSDNSENFDKAINGPDLTFADRLGNTRTTLRGQVGYVGTGVDNAIEDYSAGLVLSGYNVIIRYSGEFYRPSASATLPYTTTATLPDVDPNLAPVGDAVLRQELANNAALSGSDKIAHTGTANTVTESLDDAAAKVIERTIFKNTVAEIEALSLDAGVNVYLTEAGKEGDGVIKTGAPPSDPENGRFIVLANGNYWERAYSSVPASSWFNDDIGAALTSVSGKLRVSEGDFSETIPAGREIDLEATGETTINMLPINKKSNFGLIEKPAGFAWDAPIQIFQSNGQYKCNIDPKDYDRASQALRGSDRVDYYVDGQNGSNSNDGLTWATAKRSLGTTPLSAIGTATTAGIGNAVIHVKAGIYPRDDSWGGLTFAGNLAVLCEPGTYLTTSEYWSGITWTSEGSGTFSAPRSVVSDNHGVIDFAFTGEDGKPFTPEPLDSLAAVKGQAGSYYTDGTDVYVHLLDGREPDKLVLILLGLSNGRMADGAYSLYVENAKFYGGDGGAMRTGAGPDNVAAFKNCEFSMSTNSSGLRSEDSALTVSVNCQAHKNWLDGFNYHDYVAVGSNAIEIDCSAWKNGFRKAALDSDNSNGSSAHEAINIVRINTVAYQNYGPNIIDVNTVNCWNLGCKAFDSLAAASPEKADFEFVDTAVSAWLDGCEGGQTGVQVFGNSGSTIYVRNWSGGLSTVPSSVILTY